MSKMPDTDEQVLSNSRQTRLNRLRDMIDKGDFSGSPVPFDVETYIAAKLEVEAETTVPTSRR